MDVSTKQNVIFDPIYGFIKLTPVEWEIIHSPFYQRLRWIKQLGFSFYVFPGAEHSRFGHSIGVMYNAHKILQSIGLAVTDTELADVSKNNPEAEFHRNIRLGALLHDLGTFCFSHTTEQAYINFGETTNTKGGKGLKDDHENLGSYIIKNTDYKGGITHILKKHGVDPQQISDLVKGVDKSYIANQILHSEIDCDRMDYLLRDAHYTGLKYGSYDRDYLLYHFQVGMVDNHRILTIKENALHCIEDFLMSRFSWYSQVIRSPRGARHDAVAEKVCFYLLEKGLIYKYSDLLQMIEEEPLSFFGFNDNYFMDLVQKTYMDPKTDKDPKYKSLMKAMLFKNGVNTVQLSEFDRKLINQDDPTAREKAYKRAETKAMELREFVEKKGSKEHWILLDLPKKDIMFARSAKSVAKKQTQNNVLLERDPVKISFEDGSIKLLADVENSVITRLQNCNNYTPNVFCSYETYRLLEENKLIN